MSQPENQISKSSSKAPWLLALTLVIALIFTGSAMTQPNPPAETPQATKAASTTFTITITPGANWNDPPSVDQNSVTVDASLGDEVVWVCPACTDGFDVIFIQSGKKPFKDRSFNKAKNKSGKATGKNDTYPYKVIVNGGVLDPDVIIKGSQN